MFNNQRITKLEEEISNLRELILRNDKHVSSHILKFNETQSEFITTRGDASYAMLKCNKFEPIIEEITNIMEELNKEIDAQNQQFAALMDHLGLKFVPKDAFRIEKK